MLRITGTQYSIEKRGDNLELKLRGQVVERIVYKGRTLLEVTDQLWSTLKRKGVTMQKSIVKDDLSKLFPGVRISGPLK